MTSGSSTHDHAGTTIYSVAAAAGVSIATVSRVVQGSSAVSDRTREKVLEAIDRLDYMPLAAARSLAVRHHEALGLVLPELSGPYFSELLMGFEEAAAGLAVVSDLSGPARWFLDHARVALSSGHVFGTGGAGHVRLNFATSRAILTEAVSRMGRALADAG